MKNLIKNKYTVLLSALAFLFVLSKSGSAFASQIDITLFGNENTPTTVYTDGGSPPITGEPMSLDGIKGTGTAGTLTSGLPYRTTGTMGFSNNTFTISGSVENTAYTITGTYSWSSTDKVDGVVTGATFIISTNSVTGLDSLYGITSQNMHGELHVFLDKGTNNITSAHLVLNPASVPIPAAGWLLGSGLLGLFGIRKNFIFS